MRTWLSKWRKTDSARSILASILSILIGMAVGCVIVLIVAATSKCVGRHPFDFRWLIQHGTNRGRYADLWL